MVAEAASGKSKHHQLRAEKRAKKHESAAATPTTSTSVPEKPSPDAAKAEKAPPASAA